MTGRRHLSFIFVPLATMAALPAYAAAQAPTHEAPRSAMADSTAVVAALDAFHAALVLGDTVAVKALLHPSATILESGGVETRAEYLSHHLPGDMAFASAVQRDRAVRRLIIAGDVAWVVSTSTAIGEFRGRAIDTMGAELAVLVREDEIWRIASVHWSSRNRGR